MTDRMTFRCNFTVDTDNVLNRIEGVNIEPPSDVFNIEIEAVPKKRAVTVGFEAPIDTLALTPNEAEQLGNALIVAARVMGNPEGQ